MNDRVPGWYRLAWFLGRPPALTTNQWRLLGLVAAVSIFEQYDIYLVALNLKQIQADLAIPESQLGVLGVIVRAGSFLSVGLAIAADRWGRKTLLLLAVLGYSIFTGATAFSSSLEMFVVFQIFARGFASAEVMIAAVVITEEFPLGNRGWGIGVLAALQSLGAGLAALLFSSVAGCLLAQNLAEKKRFKTINAVQQQGPVFKSLIELFNRHSGRMIALFSAVFFFGIGASTASFFARKYLQDVHSLFYGYWCHLL